MAGHLRADFTPLVMDRPAFPVRKADGALERLVVIEHLQRLTQPVVTSTDVVAITPYGHDPVRPGA